LNVGAGQQQQPAHAVKTDQLPSPSQLQEQTCEPPPHGSAVVVVPHAVTATWQTAIPFPWGVTQSHDGEFCDVQPLVSGYQLNPSHWKMQLPPQSGGWGVVVVVVGGHVVVVLQLGVVPAEV
jgi:hypothetical protein